MTTSGSSMRSSPRAGHLAPAQHIQPTSSSSQTRTSAGKRAADAVERQQQQQQQQQQHGHDQHDDEHTGASINSKSPRTVSSGPSDARGSLPPTTKRQRTSAQALGKERPPHMIASRSNSARKGSRDGHAPHADDDGDDAASDARMHASSGEDSDSLASHDDDDIREHGLVHERVPKPWQPARLGSSFSAADAGRFGKRTYVPEFRFSGAATAVSISPTMLTEMNKTRQRDTSSGTGTLRVRKTVAMSTPAAPQPGGAVQDLESTLEGEGCGTSDEDDDRDAAWPSAAVLALLLAFEAHGRKYNKILRDAAKSNPPSPLASKTTQELKAKRRRIKRSLQRANTRDVFKVPHYLRNVIEPGELARWHRAFGSI